MKFRVNENCIGCGLCVSICPQVFTLGDIGMAQAESGDINPAYESGALLAQDDCPVDAIENA